MAYRSLRDFIDALESRGELVRVAEPVSSVLEITEICTRLLATGGPAVLFEHVIRADLLQLRDQLRAANEIHAMHAERFCHDDHGAPDGGMVVQFWPETFFRPQTSERFGWGTISAQASE